MFKVEYRAPATGHIHTATVHGLRTAKEAKAYIKRVKPGCRVISVKEQQSGGEACKR